MLRYQLSPVERTFTLHSFADASQDAYGAVVYARSVYLDGTVSSTLIAAKTKVTLVQLVNVPRLQLMAAILELRSTVSGRKVQDIPLANAVPWLDTMSVLFWIRGKSTMFKLFVANRVGEIQNTTSTDQWWHVSTKVNPAELPTKVHHNVWLRMTFVARPRVFI